MTPEPVGNVVGMKGATASGDSADKFGFGTIGTFVGISGLESTGFDS